MNYLTVFENMLELYDFKLVENDDDSFNFEDLQGANLGNIESDKITTLKEAVSRLEAYHDDYVYRSVEELYDDFGGNNYYDSYYKLIKSEPDFEKHLIEHLPFHHEYVILIEEAPDIKIKKLLKEATI